MTQDRSNYIRCRATCPACGGMKTNALRSSRLPPGQDVLRRHECRDCLHRWWSLQAPPVPLEPWQVSWENRKPTIHPKQP